MIRLVADALLRGDRSVRRAESVARLKHLMVDEYQDVNPAQETLIKELHKLSSTLFVVGDDDQAIYSWRGADVSNIVDFPTRYPSAKRHTLFKKLSQHAGHRCCCRRFCGWRSWSGAYHKITTGR